MQQLNVFGHLFEGGKTGLFRWITEMKFLIAALIGLFLTNQQFVTAVWVVESIGWSIHLNPTSTWS